MAGGEYGGKEYGSGAYDGDRLLMAAITGEDVPEEAARSAGYREAAADLDLLRLALRDLGEELGEARGEGRGEAPEGEPAAPPVPAQPPARPTVTVVPVRVRRRRMFTLALRAVAATGAAALVGGVLWLGMQDGLGGGDASRAESVPAVGDQGGTKDKGAPPTDEDAEAPSGEDAKRRPPSRARQIACARILVEGTAVDVAARPDGRRDVTVDIDRWYRPERSTTTAPSTTITLPAALAEGIERGEPVLVTVYAHSEDGYDVKQGEAAVRADVPYLLAALAHARTLTCPTPWSR
ncbi:hypothetical protein [Streptomyces sp. KLOTTS4A1]|uniref:hypothetical protein n=1 Tax=Streptomyces sp. KLOTTS4A1 TaxID=3390996 RepID=UPI0039F46CCA